MLSDIIVTVIILLGGVAIYFTLLGIIVLYNKFSAASPTGQTRQKLTASKLNQPRRPDDKQPQPDPLKNEHKRHEEEFRRKMQQRDEELLRELKQRREEKRSAEQSPGTVEPENAPPTVEPPDSPAQA